MKNFMQEGDILTVPAPTGGVLSGAVVLINKMVGIAGTDAAEGADVAVRVEGVFSVAVKSADDIAVGDLLYWDSTNTEFTKTATSNTKSGYATKAAGAGITAGEIKLTPGVG